jgi:DNA-binding response OmpR family regulator
VEANNMKILIAEDDELYSGLYDRMLTKWGYSFDIVYDGKEAVERAVENEGKYDICLMDIDMPYMGGYEATKLIRLKTKYFPILGVTGNISIKDKYSECGMDDYLKKPFDVNEFRKKINELTVKRFRLIIENNKPKVTKEMPMNKEELQELIELEKKGLSVLILEEGKRRFVVHKNIQNKMSHKLIGEGKEVFEFLDRSDEPANCHLYRYNWHTNKMLLTPKEFEKRVKEEDNDINNFNTVNDQKGSETDGD